MSDAFSPPDQRFADAEQVGHIVSELGLDIWLSGDKLLGSAAVRPELWVPETEYLRTSVLANWVDVMTGIISIDVFDGRVPVTLDLAVDLSRPAHGYRQIDATTSILKTGRSISVAEVRFTADGSDEIIALGRATFMATPDVSLTLPSRADNVALFGDGERYLLTEPFADRAECRRIGPGMASMPRRPDGLNASNTVNGGLITLVVEEAVLAAAPGATLASLAVNYLRPGRVGPVVGTAELAGEVARVEVRDAGLDNRLIVVASTRLFALDDMTSTSIMIT